MRLFLSFLLLAMLAPATTFAAQPAAPASPLEPYLKNDVFGTIVISPTGEYLAVSVPEPDRTNLVILRRSDMSMTGHVAVEKFAHVAGLTWVNPTRLLYSMYKKFGELNEPQGTGELWGLNADGTGQGPALIGWGSRDNEPLVPMARLSKNVNNVYAQIIDDLRDNDNFVLVSLSYPTGFTHVDRMNVKTGQHTSVATAPVQQASFLTDPSSAVRFATGTLNDNKFRTFYRADDKADWELINDQAVTGIVMQAVGFSADGKTAYLQVEDAGEGPDAIYTFDTATRQRRLLLQDDNTSPDGFLYSPLDGSLYGVTYMDGLPRIKYLDPTNPFAKQLYNLHVSLAGQSVWPLSFTKDGNLGVYLARADRVPGDFYLFDRSSNKATYLASKKAWFTPEMLAATQPVNFKARDSLALEGYLTLPIGGSGKNLPLVIHPHGGPFHAADAWEYDPEVQMLASHGYAVLQVNFRGSNNHGRAFERAGYRQWGGRMQDDLTDATRWAIGQGIADPRRICIFGASYGGYAALMGVAKEPDLYRCAVGNVGVYDLTIMYNKGDRASGIATSTKNFFSETLGKDHLEAVSPNLLAARIKAPVLLAAGREDETALPVHTEKMRDALIAAGKPVDAVFYDGEGHGNYLLKNRIDFYTRLLAFLDRNIGGAAPVAVAKP